MTIRMLIDASHEEETRVAVVHGNRVEEFDYESSAKKQIKGNIYLAKVTRVEPSLQAAFVEYGGNRHGFLAFSEIHPDYYQIPVADREALIAEESAAYASILDDEDDAPEEKPKRKSRRRTRGKSAQADKPEAESADEAQSDGQEDDPSPDTQAPAENSAVKAESVQEPDSISEKVTADAAEAAADDETFADDDMAASDLSRDENIDSQDDEDDLETETTGSLELDEEDAEARLRIKVAKGLRRKYKIQEVIKKNQILLIQVVKEERGNKGAALTTYMSLPGRYCVLMPNTLHGGGVSRKIANAGDRKSLKKILADLKMPSGMACIIRTAGHSRTRTEIKRDFDYLIRTWEGIRERTLKSIAPVMINEEGDLIKRSIRDLYTREIDEILVEGEQGYKTARSFMKLLMPSHARKIKHYTDRTPLLHRYQVESQLDSMYSPIVQLKSGGYIVINPTEALVSIDVNSGKATKERNIEETAKKTNLEAAEEVARQLRLRDMAGLVVIDFIDMEVKSNNRAVEQRLKECLKSDRARIQVGRISSFGLLEMSRQRLRSGVLESSTRTCPHCEGAGVIRSVETQALHIIRTLEEEGIRGRNNKVIIHLPEQTAVYLLNNKRAKLLSLEEQYNLSIEVTIDATLTEAGYKLELPGSDQKRPERQSSMQPGKTAGQDARDDRSGGARRNRQRSQSRKTGDQPVEKPAKEAKSSGDADVSADDRKDADGKPRRRRRPRRRSNKPQPGETGTDQVTETAASPEDTAVKPDESSALQEAVAKTAEASAPDSRPDTGPETGEEKPKRRRRSRKPKDDDSSAGQAASEESAVTSEDTAEKPESAAKKPARRPYPPQARSRKKASDKADSAEKVADKAADKPESKPESKPEPAQPVTEEKPAKPVESTPAEDDAPNKPKKSGWWQRTFG